MKKKLTIGILAHVDAGKTTLSEAMLYNCGAIRKLGRVDHRDSFFDTDSQERQRGITIFSKQAELTFPFGSQIMLLDTPGHIDFSAEMERTLSVLDYAILVVSGKDGVQGHTATLWKLLQRYNVPVFIFVNKMDLEGVDAKALMSQLKSSLDTACFDGRDLGETISDEKLCEELALCNEEIMEEYLSEGHIKRDSLAEAISLRQAFPCFFGSALKLEGIDEFLGSIEKLSIAKEYPEEFSAKVFKITRDEKNNRLTHLKITGGILKVRDVIFSSEKDEIGEKVSQIRIYSGEKYRTLEEAGGGTICAVTGLQNTLAGQHIGSGGNKYNDKPWLEALMSYRVILPEDVTPQEALIRLKKLEEEDPQLKVSWNQQHQEISIRIMGEVQLEILKTLIKDKLNMEVDFGQGKIAYKETIRKSVDGAGHYEPLRHYAEVRVLLEPLPEGSGMQFGSKCSESVLDRNWQRLIMTHFMEREHLGTLVGAPITDVKISVLTGRAHKKHTSGGDFRQSTYRAIRHALRKSRENGDMVLLEPWYEYELELPLDNVGRAMADIQRMGGTFEANQREGNTVLKGEVPVSEMKDYSKEVASYSKGFGRLNCIFAGYRPCHNQEAVVEEMGYDPDRDIENTADSVFCVHGAGKVIPWKNVEDLMHTSYNSETKEAKRGPVGGYIGTADEDEELEKIFQHTFNRGNGGGQKNKKPQIEPREYGAKEGGPKFEKGEEYLLVDGYNIIFAWEELKELAKINMDSAREALVDILNNYQGYRKCHVILVFDAYRTKGGERHYERNGEIDVVYTKEAETADSYIEKATYMLSELQEDGGHGLRNYNVRVATSDRMEQMIIMGNNAIRVSSKAFKAEVDEVVERIGDLITENNRRNAIEQQNNIVIPNKDTEITKEK